jgi:fibronectin-binding autotransporter adhesin
MKEYTMNRTYTPLLVLLLLCLHLIQRVEGAESQLVKPMADGSLVMLPWNEQGDKIPDFSFCGYRNGGVKLPDVPTLVTLEPSGAEDESERIQTALDDLGKSLKQTPDARGALLLKKGFWKIKKMLTMSYSGVVLRGEGDGEDGTVLLWNENEVWVPLMLTVAANGWPSGNTIRVGKLDQPYVPVGATRFRVTADAGRDAKTLGLNAGDSVTIYRPDSPEWVTDIGMDIYNWTEWTNRWSFDRKVISCENGELVFDITLPQSLDQKYGGAVIFLTAPQNRIRECGIERIRFDTIFDPSIVENKGTVNEYPSDERHPGTAISFSKIEDGWLRDCTAIHMTHGLVGLGGCRITVQDCKSLDPVSLIAGSRRYGYVLGGTSNLIQRCYSRNGRHDYMTQGGVLGPNAVVDCSAESAWDASENHQKWAMGTLFDNVRVNGTGPYLGLVSANRGRWGNGHGWSGNTTVFWNCASPVIFALQPPLGQNFMIGCSDPTLYDPVRAQRLISNQNNASGRNDQLVVGEALQGTAWKEYPNESVTPRFLYYAQLQARLGTEAVRNVTTADDTITPDPEIAVEQPVGTNLVDGSASISCGSVNQGSSSSPVTFSVKNTGTSDLTGLALTKDGTHNADFTLGSLGSATLAPNASTTFTVTFTPGAAGTKNAAIHIASNDANENPFDISLTGSGIGPGTLEVTPAGGLASSGNFGGPFSPSTLQYTLNNPGNSSIDWTAAKTAAWLTLDATGGTLAAGASATVTASINAGSNSMGIGSYNDTVTFTNTTSGSGDTTRPVSLTVNPITATVNLSDLLQTYDGFPKPVTVTTTPSNLAHSVTYNGSSTVPTAGGTYAVVATITEPNHAGSASGNLVISYAVSYLGNGNTIGTAPSNQTKLYDVALTLANNSGNLNKTDCSFAGWNTEADGSGTPYSAAGTYIGNASMTLYAQWVPGADGTWIQTAAGPFDWGTSANWNNGTVAAGADWTANFTPNLAANQTINLESARTIGNINFTDSTTASHDLTISGANILTLARTSGTPTINITNRALTISSVIVGSNGLMKSGAGTLVFNSGSNNSGTTTISAGTLQLGNGGTTGSLSTTSAIVNNGTFSITRSNAVTQGTDFSAAAITGSGNFTQRGTGTTTLNAANTYSGVTTISTGVLAFATAADGGVASSLGQSSNAAANLVMGGGAAVSLKYTGTGGSTDRLFTLTSPTFAHILDASGTGAINFTNTGAIAYGTNNAVRTLQLNGSNTGNNTLAALIQDNGTGKVSINKDWNGGAGTWVITGNNTYTGNTYLGNGTVIVTSLKNIGTASNLGAGGTIAFGLYNPAGTLKYEGTGDETNRAIDFSASGGFSTMVIDQSGTGLLKFTGTFVSSGGRDGKIVQLQGSTAGTGEMQSILVDNSPTNRTNVSKAGTGTWTLSGANTYVGNTTVSVGVLKLGNVNGLGFGGVQLTSTGTSTVTSGATLDLDGRSNVSEPITLNGDGVSSNGALVNNSATAASIGNGIAGLAVAAAGSGSGYSTAPTVVISGTGSGATATASLGLTTASIVTATGGTGWVTGDKVNITGGGGTGAIGTVTASAGAITSITITTPGTGYTTAPTGMNKNTSTAGAGTLTLTGNATNFTVSALAMTNGGSGYTGTPTFTFDGTAATVTPTLSSVALATNSSIGGTGDITINAVVSGSTRALTKVGAGTLTLAGANTSTGATTVSAGTLAVTGSLGATDVSVNAGTLSGNGNIGGSVTIASGATHALAVAATTGAQLTRAITGTLTLTSGNILDLTAAATPAAGVYVLATATTAITGTPTTINYNGITGGTVSVDTVSSPKRLLLTVTAGTLEVTPAGGLASSGNFGGPFSPSTLQYTLNNPGNSSIDWTAAKTAAWLTLDATGGTLAAGASATVTASINAGANSLGIGSYNDTVIFTNTTSGTGDTTRAVSLTVNPIPATVNLSNLLQTYDGFPKPVTVTTTPSGLAHSVTYNGSSTVPTNGGTYAVVATITAPNYTGSASSNLVVSYTVTYQGNGNTSGTVPAAQTKFHDVALTLANNSGNLNKTDYSFAGWNTAADGSGTAYPAAGTYSGNASLTLYAQWVPGADGTWIQTAAGPFDWGTSANWNNGTVAAGTDRTANFTPNFAANQTINLESARTIGNITFTDSTTASHDLTISGANILTLARTSGTPTINVTNRALTISSVIAGSNGLMKSGAGTLVFNSGSNNSGTTTISAGTLQLGNGGTAGSLSTTSAIVNNGTFAINRSNAVTQGTDFSGAAITGTGGFTQGGSGTTTLNAANTYSGTTSINAGTLSVSSLANSGTASNLGTGGSIEFGSFSVTGNLVYTGTGASTDRAVNLTGLTGGGTIDQSGTGLLKFTGNFTASGAGSKTLGLSGSTAGIGEISGTIVDNSVTNKTGVNKSGTGTWILSGNNTYTGRTSIQGTLSVTTLADSGTASNLGTGGTIGFGAFGTGGTLVYNGTAANTNRVVDLSGTSAGGTIDQSGTGLLKFTSNFTASGIGAKTLTLRGSTTGTGEIAGTIVDNAPSIAGIAYIPAGPGTNLVNTLTLYSVTGIVVGASVSGSGSIPTGTTVTAINGNVITLSNTTTGPIYNASTLLITGVTNPASITGVTKSGTGTWTLSGSNTNTGATTINGGVIQAAALANGGTASSIGQSTNAANNLVFGAPTATLRYTGSTNATTDRGFTLSSGVGGGATIESSGSGTLTFDNTVALAYGTTNQTRLLTLGGTNTGANTFSKVIANNGSSATSFTKDGTGLWVLAGTNTYTGATTVTAGTLSVTGSLAATAVSVANTATLSGNGNIGGNVSIASGATHSLAVAATTGAQLTRAITGTLTLTAGNILNLTAAATPAAGVYVLATATTAITGTPTTINYNGITGTVSVDTVSSPKRLLLTVTAGTPYDTWANGTFANAFTDKLPGSNPDGDGLTNLQEFAFGTDPTVSSGGSITWSGAAVTGHGTPVVIEESGIYYAVYGRRVSYVADGLTYTQQFSPRLSVWGNFATAPTVIATDGIIEAVKVPFPGLFDYGSGLEEAKFFRLGVSQ